jgi:hypothetical protein
MSRMINLLAVTVVFVGCGVALQPKSAEAQHVITSYYPVQPAVSYVPRRAGLFGRRVAYQPVVSYSAPVTVAPAVSYYAPSQVTTSYYAPSQVTTSYYVAPAPVVTRRVVVAAPVRNYYYAPRRVYRRPVVVYPY